MKSISLLLAFLTLLISLCALATSLQVWTPSFTYQKGDKVAFDGNVYETKWCYIFHKL